MAKYDGNWSLSSCDRNSCRLGYTTVLGIDFEPVGVSNVSRG